MNYIQIDKVGTAYDAEGSALPGWHVIASGAVKGWGAFRVQPETPPRVFAGVPTFFYTFADEAECNAALETVDLTIDQAPVEYKITRLAFLNRFTDAEAVTIDLASQGATVQAASMRRYTNKINAAEHVDLQRVETRNGVLALEAIGILSAGRASQILDAEVKDYERWKG